MISRILAIASKEFHQIWRDKRSLGLLIFLPTFILLLYGYALSLDMRNIPLAAVDEDRTLQSRQFLESLLRSEYFIGGGMLRSRADVQPAIERGKAEIVVIIPKGFAEALSRGETAVFQAIVDGSVSSVASAAVGYLEAFTQNHSLQIRAEALQRAGGRGLIPVDYRPRVWFNPELKSSRFLVPGLITFVLIITTAISTSLSIVRERERGTMEQIIVSPVTNAEFVVGKIIPYFVSACFLAVAVIVASAALFDVPVRGSIPLLVLSLLLFIIGGLGLGLFFSTVAHTQETAFFLAVFATVLPTQLLSGFIFPIENMPPVLQAITMIVPARYLLTILRALLLKGAPLEAFWGSMAALAAFAALTVSLSIARLSRVSGRG
jgi:ABC-2 type transport system permease protein